MPVVSNAIWQVHAGRQGDIISAMSRSRAIHERLGARVFAIQATVAGTNSLRVNYLQWFPDLGAFGQYSDALAADTEWQVFVRDVLNSANPMATLIANSVGVDVPGFDTALPERQPAGTVLSTVQWQPQPGRMAEVVQRLAEWRGIASRHGLTTRFVQTSVGGPQTGILTTAIVFPNMTAYAKSSEALQADPAFQQLWQAALAADAAATPLGQTLGRVMPI